MVRGPVRKVLTDRVSLQEPQLVLLLRERRDA